MSESHSNSKEEQQKQLIQLPRSRWITATEWTHYIQEDPHCPLLRNRRPSDVSIFRVPKFLKDTKREAYVPQRVSLGPYHHGSAELPSMGHHKGRALRRMMKRFNANKNLLVDLDDMDFANRAMEEIMKLENQIRDSYEENIDCDGETLARMLCLDGCFLIEVLRSLGGDNLSTEEADECYDPIFGENKLEYAAKDVLKDILMLENQIPFIVLLKLLQLELNSAVDDVEDKLFDLLSVGILNMVNPFDNIQFDVNQWPFHHHLLGFFHTIITSPAFNEGEQVDPGKCCIPIHGCSIKCIRLLQGKRKAGNDAKRIPHAVELRNAGIKFKPLQGGVKEINFDEDSATIFLPPISIMSRTERVFRNLIAFEMGKPSEINYVTCYVILMDELIDSEHDVALLRRMGVLTNWLGSDKEVADLFNSLGDEVTANTVDVFDKLTEKVNAHYNNEVKVQIGNLVQDHFSSPWKALALTAAIVILVLTVLQTIFIIISTYK